MAKLLYQGHGSYRITADDGAVIYVDPYVGSGYDLPADLVLVTHEHSDHNRVSLVEKKPGCRVIRSADAQKNGRYQTFKVGEIGVEAVEAYNRNHKKSECVGFILTLDGVTVYASGDTSETGQMKSFAARKLDYALLPVDGVYNMGPAEASKCAKLIGAKHTVPVHTKLGVLFDETIAEAFRADGRLILRPGEEIEL